MTEKEFPKSVIVTSIPSLNTYNEQRQKQIKEAEETAHLAGVLCPECLKDYKEVELHQETNSVLLSNPPQVNVWCPECKFRGHRIA